MKSMLKTVSVSVIFALLAVNLTAMGAKDVPDNGKKNVAVTFDAIKELTGAVAKDKVNIMPIIPPGMEAHGFEPKAKDLAFLSKADVLVYNGLDMEFWLEKALDAVKNDKLVKIEAVEGITPIKAEHHYHGEGVCPICGKVHGHEEGEEHDHHHGEFDPHAWLSLTSAKIMVQNIEKGLSKADPENAQFYKENADKYIAELDMLLKDYTAKFESITNKHFVTGHAAFAYLCRDFKLEQNAVMGVFAEGEPNAKELAELVEYCKKNKVKVIFSEEAASPEISKTLAKELGVKVEKIYTIEIAEDNMSYLERMALNLKKIYENLK
ncbi:metal ABC transporter solute-binding protein, Zn/Mn family [Treponema pedis]|uniref:metal ABC transporter solute-binding protein, Zn/Mn family n=1 Tax=Treponema pedis TaxID=409322 RepID=UPI0019825E09|nr:zinc ABC transporter substrate-binding protein [Treponema pedis]QSI04864.1 ABC transporter substrate-binding protein [Treponema pedis]